MPKNFDWYPRNIAFITPSRSLSNQTNELDSLQVAKFLFDKIRIDGEREVSKVIRIFRASEDGWNAADFHRECDNKGPTLSLIRSSVSYLAAGFTSKSWTSVAGHVEDESAMVFALTHEPQSEPQMFKTNYSEQAVWHNQHRGPYF